MSTYNMDPKIFECFGSSERAVKAVARLQAKKYDTDSWNMLIKEATNKNIDEVEPFYEELVKIFPTCGRFWRTYVDHEMKFRRYDKVSRLFQRSLEEVLSIDLYKCYLNYVREAKANEPDLILKAFRHALNKVGTDPNAISMYNDYIQFLKEREVDGSYLDSQKITAIRKAYQEGVMNPMFHIDTLWKEYISYEQSINSIIADKMIQDRSREHMNARRVAKEWEVTIRGLNRSAPAVPPTFSSEEQKQVEIWRRYIQWELSNPLRTENNLIVERRVSYAYKQCLLCLGHYPNVWHEYANYLDEQAKSFSEKEAEISRRLLREEASLFERAIKGLMKQNLFIHFAYADFEESRNDRKKALEIYDNLIEAGSQDESIDLTLVYIQLIRFKRRTEGLIEARKVIRRARDDKRCNHHIYTAAALMEYHCTKDQARACKAFELGALKFGACPDYILSHIHFMNSLNDQENNTRVLFERVLTTSSLQPKDTVEIWNSFLEFEAGIGDLSSINKVERRRMTALGKVFPKSTNSSWAIDKYKFQDLYPCSLNELRSLGYDPQQSSTSSAPVKQLMSLLSLQQGATANNQVTVANTSNIKKAKSSTRGRLHNGGSTSEFMDGDNDGEYPLSNLNRTTMCQPDLDQMLPFKPVMAAGYGAHAVPGGVFPPPPAIGNLLSRLPQPNSFWGPFVDIEQLCNLIRMSDFDELYNNLVELRRETSKQQRVKKPRIE